MQQIKTNGVKKIKLKIIFLKNWKEKKIYINNKILYTVFLKICFYY